jgi:HK97 family phage major capsid protein
MGEEITTPAGETMITLNMDQFKQLMQENVNTLIKALGLDKVDIKHGVFPNTNQEDMKKTAAERTLKWFRSMVRGDIHGMEEIDKRANLAEGTGNLGGYLVPEEFMNEVLRLVPEYGLARRLMRYIELKRDKMYIPTVTTTGVTAYWVNEAAQITASQPVFGRVAIDSQKAAVIIPSTSELLDDADLLLNLLTQMAAEQFAYAEDYQAFQGTGSPITGLFTSANVTKVVMGSGKTSLADMTFDDIIDMENAVPSNYLEGATWIMHRSAFKYVRKLKDDAGSYIYVRPEKLVDEYPFAKAETAPTTVTTANKGQIALVNLKKTHVFADRKQISVLLMKEGTVGSDNLGEKDMVAFRFIERVDIQETTPAAAAVLWTAAS